MSIPCPVCGCHHKSKCHVCPHDADRQAGKFTGKPWSKTPCSACVADGDSGEVSHKGHSHVSLDGDSGPCREVVVQVMKLSQEPTERDEHPLEEFMQFILELARLDPKARDVTLLRLLHDVGDQKWEYKAIAKRHGMSTQSAEQMHRHAIQDSPILQRVFSWKIQKQLRRTPKRRGGLPVPSRPGSASESTKGEMQ